MPQKWLLPAKVIEVPGLEQEEKGNKVVEQIVSGLCSKLRSSIVGPAEGNWVLGKRGVKESTPPRPWKDRTVGPCPQTSSDADC